QQGLRPTGDFGRLQELLSRQLGSSRRLAVRRANLVDLLEEVLESGLERVLTAGIADHQLQEARLQAAGYARVAGLEVPELQAGGELVVLRRQAAAMEGRFLADVRQSVEQ
ncbi:MAG: hypothetical protein ACK6EB_37515, partial [Planctomyces sp.]